MLKYLLLLPLLILGSLAHAAVVTGDEAPTFILTSASGEQINLADHSDKVVILEWVNYDCPFVKNHYNTGTMQALQKVAVDNGMVWLSICSSASGKQGNFTGQELSDRIAKEKSAATAYLIDEDGTVGKAYGAKTTPHMFIIKDGKIVYSGGIDSISSTKAEDIEKATPYVKEAIEAIVADGDIPNSDTKAYGCGVKY